MSMNDLLGLNADKLSVGQMCLRSLLVYIVALMMVRIVGDRRFAGKYAAFDIILSITLGATLSRAINGSAAFMPTLAAGFTLVGLHWLMAAVSFRLPMIENWVKGRPRILVQAGQVNQSAVKSESLTEQDLTMALRTGGKITDLDEVSLAVLEPSGGISVIPQKTKSQSSPESSSAQVVNISVEEGVQTVRVFIHRQ